jgi:surface polysaccharide O-acyltransferase-like enzyme
MAEAVSVSVPSSQAKSPRNLWVDLARLLMAVFVIGIHTSLTSGWTGDLMPQALLNATLFRTAVPFFFLCTAYFTYDRFLRQGRNPKVFYKAALRYLELYVLWIILYIPLVLSLTYNGKGYTAGAYLSWFFQRFFFTSPVTVLWYLRASAVGLLLLGLIHQFHLKAWYFLPAATLLFLAGMFDDSYYGFLAPAVATFVKGYNKIFVSSLNCTFYASFFLLMGEVVHDFQEKRALSRRQLWLLAGLAFFFLGCLFLESYLLYAFSKPKDCNFYLSLLFFDPLLLFLLLALPQPPKSPWIAPYLGGISALMYFSHIYFREAYSLASNDTPWFNYFHLEFWWTVVLAFLFGLAITQLTRLRPLRFLKRLY